jgi:hypothetical protein
MEKWQKEYAVYIGGKTICIMRVDGGSFAADAYRESDEAFARIMGSSFPGLFGDTGEYANAGKNNIRRCESEEEFNKLYSESCDIFKAFDKLYDKLNNNWNIKLMSWEMVKPNLLELRKEYEDMPINEFVQIIINYVNK